MNEINGGYYKAARGYEFYLRVLKVSLNFNIGIAEMSRFKKKNLFYSFSKWRKNGKQPLKHACCVTWYESYEKQNHGNVKFGNKNVIVVDKNYIDAEKYLTKKRKLAFYWLTVFVTMTTPIFSHVKDKNDMFTARGEDMIFSKRRNPGISSVSM